MRELEKNQCPRCGGGIPNDARRGEYPGALSRYDNETEVCSGCGTEEAMQQHFKGTDALLKDHEQWWVNRTDS